MNWMYPKGHVNNLNEAGKYEKLVQDYVKVRSKLTILKKVKTNS